MYMPAASAMSCKGVGVMQRTTLYYTVAHVHSTQEETMEVQTGGLSRRLGLNSESSTPTVKVRLPLPYKP